VVLERLAKFDDTQTLVTLGGHAVAELVHAASGSDLHELHPVSEPGAIYEVRAYPLKGAATLRGWLLSLRDVTEERRRRSREHQQARMAAVGQMAAGIAHQFNNSLASIVLYGDLIARSSISPDDQRRLQVILREARLTADLVQQLLDFSHQALVVRSHFDLVPFIARLLDIWTHTLPQTIVVAFECADEVKLVRADPTRLQQALMNLVAFAEKAMPAGGTLWLAVESVSIAEGAAPIPEVIPGTYAVITLKHTGTPIPPAVLPHIFEPFFVGEGITAAAGMSLAQVYGIIAQHDGGISVVSDANSGTEFTIYLPLVVEADVVPGAAPAPAARADYSTTIIVLEDPALLRQLQVRLSGRGRRVLTSTSGLDALRRYSVDLAGVDLVVTTPDLADISGDELWRVVREIAPTARAMFLSRDGSAASSSTGNFAGAAGQASWQRLPESGPDYDAAITFLVNQILAADSAANTD
jgi:signal transduction histidine kinase